MIGEGIGGKLIPNRMGVFMDDSAKEVLDYNSRILEVVNYFKLRVKEIKIDTSDENLDDILLNLSEESGLSDLMIDHLDEILESCSDKKITFFNRFINVILGLEQVSERKIKAAVHKLKSDDKGFIFLDQCLKNEEIKQINLYGACMELKKAVKEIKKARLLKSLYFIGTFIVVMTWAFTMYHGLNYFFGLEIVTIAWAMLAPIMEPHYTKKKSIVTFFQVVNLARMVMLVLCSIMIVAMNYTLYSSVACGLASLILIYFLFVAYMHDFRKAN